METKQSSSEEHRYWSGMSLLKKFLSDFQQSKTEEKHPPRAAQPSMALRTPSVSTTISTNDSDQIIINDFDQILANITDQTTMNESAPTSSNEKCSTNLSEPAQTTTLSADSDENSDAQDSDYRPILDMSLSGSECSEQSRIQADEHEQRTNVTNGSPPRSKRIRTQVVPYDQLKLSKQQK